jgi:hypothetical protein
MKASIAVNRALFSVVVCYTLCRLVPAPQFLTLLAILWLQDVCGDGPWVQEAASTAAAAAAQAASFGHVEALERVVSAASAMVSEQNWSRSY